MLGILRTLSTSAHYLRKGGLMCRSIRKPALQPCRSATQGPLMYRDCEHPDYANDKLQILIGDCMLAAFWYFMFMHIWYNTGPVGFHEVMDPSKFTDEELGIPPDDYDGEGEPFPGIPRDQALHVNAKCYYPEFPDYPVMKRKTNIFGLEQAPV